MNILIICKGQLETQPPIMSLAFILKKIGYSVNIITSYSNNNTISFFLSNGIIITNVFNHNEKHFLNLLNKIIHWKLFSIRVWKYISYNAKDSVLWISTADTALALGNKLTKMRYVLQILELYDTLPIYRYLLAKYAQQAVCVVVPEMCRAAIFRVWYSLETTPIVLPNKPDNHPKLRQLFVEDDSARNILATIKKEEKILLYQGNIGSERHLHPIAKAVQKIGNGWKFVVMGTVYGDYLKVLKKNCPDIVYIPHVNAPAHLQITSYAHVGIISYSYNKLNHIFCAPNKIWEYSGFGLPMICNELPALIYAVQYTNSGICLNMENRLNIENALETIDYNYDLYSQNSRKMYDSVDTTQIISNIMSKVNSCS